MQQLPTHVLIKYISQKKFMDDFMAGSLYMNSLYYFWNEFMLEDAKKGKQIPLSELAKNKKYGQIDLFEGSVSTATIDEKIEESKYFMSDYIYRAVGYGYCDILSFYKINLSYLNDIFVSYNTSDMMQSLGGYVAIIKDKNELIRRIQNKCKENGYKFLSGNVSYRQVMRNGVQRKEGNSVIAKADVVVDIRNLKQKRDAFIKMNKYSYQNEWRVALYRGEKDTSAFRLEIGDISDIVECCSVEDIESVINGLLRNNQIKYSSDIWEGNVDRKEMRELFYALGDYKGEMLVEIG